MDAFEKKHEPIKKYFCTGIGIKLQYLDSQIAEEVMLHFSKAGFAILPLHDSFIIHHGCEEALNESMNKAFFSMFGVECQVDLKYNSWNATGEEIAEYNIEPTVCDDRLEELLDLDSGVTGDYRKYNSLLSAHWSDLARQDNLKEASGCGHT